jgi:hypothetical protein
VATEFEKSFKLFHKAALFKQLAQNVWHGSVIASIVDGNLDLINMAAIGDQMSRSVNLRDQSGTSNDLWEELKAYAEN